MRLKPAVPDVPDDSNPMEVNLHTEMPLLRLVRPAGEGVASVVRSFDPTEINRIINDPAVFPSHAVPGIDRIDVSPLVSDHRNVLLMVDGGGIIFCADEPGIYGMQPNFLPAFRGQHATDVSLEACRWMFTRTDCLTLTARIPVSNRGALKLFEERLGFSLEFVRPSIWPTADGKIDMRFSALQYSEWVKHQSAALIEAGRSFHERLSQGCERLGRARGDGVEDVLLLHLGAFAAAIYGGQPEKAIAIFNRWARFAGYNKVSLVSRSPLVIDVGEAVLLITDQAFEVIKCQSLLH